MTQQTKTTHKTTNAAKTSAPSTPKPIRNPLPNPQSDSVFGSIANDLLQLIKTLLVDDEQAPGGTKRLTEDLMAEETLLDE